MQRDYILRLIEQVGQLLSRVIRQRKANTPQEALQSVMAACERLFGLEAVQIFQFTPDQHFLMLTDGEDAEAAREKVLMYAALNREAGLCYTSLSQPKLAQHAFVNALRLTLKARTEITAATWPEFAPSEAEILTHLDHGALDDDTASLLATAGVNRPPS